MKSGRFGIVVIAIALLALGASAVMFAQWHQQRELALTDTHARILGSVLMQRSRANPTNNTDADLQQLLTAAKESALLWIEIATAQGAPVASASSPARPIPRPVTSDSASGSSGSDAVRVIELGGERYREYRISLPGATATVARLGYLDPAEGMTPAVLAAARPLLPAALVLVALLVWAAVREARSLGAIRQAVRAHLESDPQCSEHLSIAGDGRDLGAMLGSFLQAVDARLASVESERSDVLTLSRVVSYEKARIESVLQSIPQGVVVLDEAGMATFANAKLGPMMDVEPEAVVGNTVAQWSPFPELTEFVGGTGLARGKSTTSGSIELQSADNSTCLSAMAFPLFSLIERDELLGTLVVFADVTEQRFARQAQKDLIAELSHELKTPLQVIGMYSETLLDDGGKDAAVRIEAGNVIHDEVERVTALINNILSISRIEMGSVPLKRRRTRLSDLLQDCLDSVGRSGSEQGLEFSLEIPPDLSVVNVDKDLMRVAVNNLITNAIKYNRPGGKVVVGASETADEISIFVRDTGIGINEADKGRVFERFFRGESSDDSQVGGHGLGLPLTKEIVNVHMGEIDVTSIPGEGSEFRVRLRKTTSLLKEAA